MVKVLHQSVMGSVLTVSTAHFTQHVLMFSYWPLRNSAPAHQTQTLHASTCWVSAIKTTLPISLGSSHHWCDATESEPFLFIVLVKTSSDGSTQTFNWTNNRRQINVKNEKFSVQFQRHKERSLNISFTSVPVWLSSQNLWRTFLKCSTVKRFDNIKRTSTKTNITSVIHEENLPENKYEKLPDSNIWFQECSRNNPKFGESQQS